nr:hypothetical protein [Tanacetum cinerariifolium]
MNVFMRIGFGSTIELVSFDESQVVTFNGKFICGFRNGDCGTESQSDTRSAAYMGSSSMGLRIFKGNEKVTEVIDVENWRIDNSRVLRYIVSLIEGNSSVSLTKSLIQNGKCGAQSFKCGVLIELIHSFYRAFNSFDCGEKYDAQRPDGKCGAQSFKCGVLIELIHSFHRAFNSIDCGEKYDAQR